MSIFLFLNFVFPVDSKKSSFVIFYHCDETMFVGANLSYGKVQSGGSTANYTDESRDLASFNAANFEHQCFENNANSPGMWLK